MAEGPIVREGVMSAICKSFGCTPSQALAEDPQWIFPILEYRLALTAMELVHKGESEQEQKAVMEMLKKNPEIIEFWKEFTRVGQGVE